MQNLTVIENELVPVYETSAGEKVVYGSELHDVLGIRTPYKDWSSRRLSDVDALEGEDFEAAQICAPSGQTKKDHIIKLDTAKEMAMLERNEKGKQVRRYFIQVEKKYKENTLNDLSPELKAVIIVDKRITKVEKKVEHLYIRKSKCVAGFIAYLHSCSFNNSRFLINMFIGKWHTTSKLEYLLSLKRSSINTYIKFSESYSDIFL